MRINSSNPAIKTRKWFLFTIVYLFAFNASFSQSIIVEGGIPSGFCKYQQLNFSCSGPDLTDYQWDFGDGATSSEEAPTHYYTQNNTYLVVLSDGTNPVCSLNVAIANADECVVLTSSCTNCCINSVVSFEASELLPTQTSITWSFDDPSSGGNNFSTGTTADHQFVNAGSYLVSIYITETGQTFVLPIAIVFDTCAPPCQRCLPFEPHAGEEYILSYWVREENLPVMPESYSNAFVEVTFYDVSSTIISQIYSNNSSSNTQYSTIIDKWQQVNWVFETPANTRYISITLSNPTVGVDAYFDDIRIHPFSANMKSYVYDAVSGRLYSELDENNYATFYEYDEEGRLVRIKKETEDGVKTLKEAKSFIKLQP